ncbi:MAG: hypothetical protein DRQ06_00075 [Candidatus Hydrothermota bacterium]|nr:MAG: hypothetical protein DRQ06_00075 [Candidatus Hydrothermae bacterium]
MGAGLAGEPRPQKDKNQERALRCTHQPVMQELLKIEIRPSKANYLQRGSVLTGQKIWHNL